MHKGSQKSVPGDRSPPKQTCQHEAGKIIVPVEIRRPQNDPQEDIREHTGAHHVVDQRWCCVTGAGKKYSPTRTGAASTAGVGVMYSTGTIYSRTGTGAALGSLFSRAHSSTGPAVFLGLPQTHLCLLKLAAHGSAGKVLPSRSSLSFRKTTSTYNFMRMKSSLSCRSGKR